MIRTLEVLIKKLIINKKLIKKWLVIVLPYFCLSQSLISVMECNEELFPEIWYEKSTFPKQTIYMMSTLTEI